MLSEIQAVVNRELSFLQKRNKNFVVKLLQSILTSFEDFANKLALSIY
jgi:hypothetical protein